MPIALIALDRPGALQTRLDNRDAHLAYVADSGAVDMAGPFLDDTGQMCGSLLILSTDNMDEARTWAANDPYAKAGLFASVSLRTWKKVLG